VRTVRGAASRHWPLPAITYYGPDATHATVVRIMRSEHVGPGEIARGARKMNWKRLSFIWSRAAPVVAFAAYMTLQNYLAVQTWGLHAAPTVSIITATAVASLLLLWIALRWGKISK